MRRQTVVAMMLLWILVGIGCATHLSGNPNYNWLNGKWFAVRGSSGWTTELDLRVVDGNKVIGTNIQTGSNGRQGFGDVNGMVEDDKVSIEVYLPRSGNTHTYTLFRKGNALQGRGTTGSVTLQKAS